MMPVSGVPHLLEPGSSIPATAAASRFRSRQADEISRRVLSMKTTIVVSLAFLCLSAAGPDAQAVVPPPDGGYSNFNTAEGQNSLFSLTTGAANTAVGWFSLFSDTEGSFNTATGAGTLLFNAGDQNTAVGAAALYSTPSVLATQPLERPPF
jgi:hypothetical protein